MNRYIHFRSFVTFSFRCDSVELIHIISYHTVTETKHICLSACHFYVLFVIVFWGRTEQNETKEGRKEGRKEEGKKSPSDDYLAIRFGLI